MAMGEREANCRSGLRPKAVRRRRSQPTLALSMGGPLNRRFVPFADRPRLSPKPIRIAQFAQKKPGSGERRHSKTEQNGCAGSRVIGPCPPFYPSDESGYHLRVAVGPMNARPLA